MFFFLIKNPCDFGGILLFENWYTWLTLKMGDRYKVY